MQPVRIFYYMDITQMPLNQKASVVSVECERELSERLSSLNVRPKAQICLLKVSVFKKTYLLWAGGSYIALRREVAKCIKIQL